MHRVAVVAVPPITPFDLSIPELVLGAAEVGGAPGYEVRTVTADPGRVASTGGSFEVVVRDGLDELERADTVIVTGTGARVAGDPRVLAALRSAVARGGADRVDLHRAFVLTQAGLLDGRSATSTGCTRRGCAGGSPRWTSARACSTSPCACT